MQHEDGVDVAERLHLVVQVGRHLSQLLARLLRLDLRPRGVVVPRGVHRDDRPLGVAQVGKVGEGGLLRAAVAVGARLEERTHTVLLLPLELVVGRLLHEAPAAHAVEDGRLARPGDADDHDALGVRVDALEVLERAK